MGRPPSCTCDECQQCRRKLYMREWYRRTRRTYVDHEKRRAYDNARYRDDPVHHAKVRARQALVSSVRRGVQSTSPCALCGSPEVVGHHNDYTRPTEATWLCRTCHNMVHSPVPATEAVR